MEKLMNTIGTALVAVVLACVFLILTGCESAPKREFRLQGNLMSKCPPLSKIEDGKGATFALWAKDSIASYNWCRATHNELVDALDQMDVVNTKGN